jgi:hypothetical protein
MRALPTLLLMLSGLLLLNHAVVAQIAPRGCQRGAGSDIFSNSFCSSGNPEYKIVNNLFPQDPVTNYKICRETRAPGSPRFSSKTFIDKQLAYSSKPIVLGCKFENGVEQRFTVHWTGNPDCTVPLNIEDARSAVDASKAGNGYLLRNFHFFKNVQIDYTDDKGKRQTFTLGPGKSDLALGSMKNPPNITRAVYLVPYDQNSGSCLSPNDHYPPSQLGKSARHQIPKR